MVRSSNPVFISRDAMGVLKVGMQIHICKTPVECQIYRTGETPWSLVLSGISSPSVFCNLPYLTKPFIRTIYTRVNEFRSSRHWSLFLIDPPAIHFNFIIDIGVPQINREVFETCFECEITTYRGQLLSLVIMVTMSEKQY